MDPSSRNRLNERHLEHFPGESLFDKIARTVCRAGCLPRKELYEAWEVARRVRRRFTGRRIIDMACGHGLLAQIMVLLDDSVPAALAIDRTIPKSAATLEAVMVEEWPQLVNRVKFRESDISEIKLDRDDMVLSVHGCGNLTDQIIGMAIEANSAVALLPCCHNLKQSDTGSLEGWMEGTLAVDATRVARLIKSGYTVITQEIPHEITPKNRLLIASPK